MAGLQNTNPSSAGHRIKQSRLQKRAPASIQVNPTTSFAADWKVAIPLLSPLVLSPTSPPKFSDRTAEKSSSSCTSSSSSSSSSCSSLREDSVNDHRQIEKQVFKTWQHPAAPLHYEPGPYLPPFVPKCR